jgi:hypothetical protein
MVYGHMILFWLRLEDFWLKHWLYAFLQPIGATGFLFISGVSSILAYKTNQQTKKIEMSTMRNIYIVRAILILIIGLLFNFGVAMVFEGGNLTYIWSWNALQTIAISLILTWPFLKTSKVTRITIAIAAIILNQILLNALTPYRGETSIFGIIYHILFNPIDQYVILNYFGIVVIGSVIGDYVYDLKNTENGDKREYLFTNRAIIFSFFLGITILAFGILFLFPTFLIFNTLSSVLYSIGLIMATLSILIVVEVLELIKTKKSYRYLYFYSYYSFTIFLGHNLLLMLFFRMLNFITIWIVIIIFIAILGWFFRYLYHKAGPKASVKTGISIASTLIVMKLEKRDISKLKEEAKLESKV